MEIIHQSLPGYEMPDGSFLFSMDGGSQAAMAWAMEAIKEFKKINQRLARIEKKLDAVSNGDGT